MIVRVVLGSLLSAMALMIWGFVYWDKVAPGLNMLPPPPNVAEIKKQINAPTGCYFIPGMPKAGDPTKNHDAWIKGPVVQLFIHHEGVDPNDPRLYLEGFAQFFLSSLLAGFLLARSKMAAGSYVDRLLFVTLLGVFAAVTIHVSDAIWFYHAKDWTLFNIAYVVVGWLLAGVVMAIFVREVPAKVTTAKV